MKRRFKVTDVEVGGFSTNFTIKDIDHENQDNQMNAQCFFHHLGLLAGFELNGIEGLEFTVELKEGKINKPDPLDMCGKTI